MKEFTGGKGKYLAFVNDELEFLKKQYTAAQSFEEQIGFFGMMEGMDQGSSMTHKGLIEKFIEIKKDIADLQSDEDLYGLEIIYLEGFMNGMEKVLNLNRYYFKNNVPIFILALFENENLLDTYKMAAILSGFQEYRYETENSKNTFFFTTSFNELKNVSECVDKENYDLTVNFVFKYKTDGKTWERISELPTLESFRYNIVKNYDQYNAQGLIKRMIKNVCLDK